jgi:hypothetical protein
VDPTWDFFVDAVKEQYYHVGNYEDQYMRWTTLQQERGQAVLEFTNAFHTVITEILSTNGYRNPTSPNNILVHPWTKNVFPKGPKLYNQQ